MISFLDFLPFFRNWNSDDTVGCVSVFMGDYKMTVSLVVLYVITQVVRQLLQPKMVGDSVGLNPLVTLLLLYVGYKAGGLLWMILSVPVGMVLINMCQAGAFDYIFNDVEILVEGVLGLHENEEKIQEEKRRN